MKKSFFLVFLLTAGSLICSCSSNKREMNLKANRDLIRKYHEVKSKGQVAELDKMLAPDFVCHFIKGIEFKGIDGIKNAIINHRKSFPDWKEEIVDMISEGDKVVARFKSTGTHEGTFNGLDSTGKKVSIYEAAIYRIANGKIAEQWSFPDVLGLNSQLEAKNKN